MELNRLKVVLVEKKKTGKWLAEKLKKMRLLFLDGVQMNLDYHLKLWLPLLRH